MVDAVGNLFNSHSPSSLSMMAESLTIIKAKKVIGCFGQLP